MGLIQEFSPDNAGGIGKKRQNPGMSGDYTPEEFPVEQVPNPVEGGSNVQPAQPVTKEIGMGDTSPKSFAGQDGNELGTAPQVQTSKFNDNGVQGPKSPRPAKL